jgi:hypothetical protein
VLGREQIYRERRSSLVAERMGGGGDAGWLTKKEETPGDGKTSVGAGECR